MSSHIVESSAKTGAEIRQGILESVEKTLLLNLSLEPHVCYTDVSWEVEVRVKSVPEVASLKVLGKLESDGVESSSPESGSLGSPSPESGHKTEKLKTERPRTSPSENYREATKGLVGKDTL